MFKTRQITAMSMVIIMVILLVACNTQVKKDEATITNSEDTLSVEQSESIKFEEAEDITINLHYLRDDDNYEGWNVWVWSTGDGASYQFDTTKKDDNGVVTSVKVPVSVMQVGFIIRLNEWEMQDTEGDRYIDISDIVEGTIDIYAVTGKQEFEIVNGADVILGSKVITAIMNEDLKQVDFELSTDLATDPNTAIMIMDDTYQKVDTEDITMTGKKGVIGLKETADPLGSYFIIIDSKYKFDINTPDLFSSDSFEKEYTYNGELGMSWSTNQTSFRMWAPTATTAKVNLYSGGDATKSDLIESIEMKSDINGTWIAEKEGDLNGVYYTYTVNVNGMESEACDPYAVTTGVNGDRAMIIDMDSTNPKDWSQDKRPNSDLNITDAVIYELHVRDLSSDPSSGIKNTGKYLGLTEKGTKNSEGVSTGLDHMLDLGITHLHLNPIYDFATVDESKLDESQYNWGYDPKNYNTPEGSYSTDPYNGAVRVQELKQMVQTLHENNISVVMDVVYNHTYNMDYCFNKLVPNYFYRMKEDGTFSNGSGCGNDVASERAMVSKFIVDSVVYWAEEYHIDGFRFDLVGLTDIETINKIRTELNKIDPSIIMYGEGWTMETDIMKEGVILSTQPNTASVPGMAMFNDDIRDALKGSVFNAEEKGFVNGEYSTKTRIMDNILGLPAWSPSPSQVINYTSCHDNLTLWDKINSSNGEDSLEDRIKQNLLAASIIYTSQGVPFMLAGEELLRTKIKPDGTFDHNSYASSTEINSMKWDVLNDEQYRKVYEFYKGLIAFRKAHASLRMENDTKENITFLDNLEDGVIAYSIDKVEGEVSDGIFVIINGLRESTKVSLPKGNWTICIEGEQAGTSGLGTAKGKVTVEPISCTVLVKGALQ